VIISTMNDLPGYEICAYGTAVRAVRS